MEVLKAVEMAATPRLIDAARLLIDSAVVRIGELAACDTPTFAG